MPRGPKGEKRPADVIGAAVMVGRIATGEIEDIATVDEVHPQRSPRRRCLDQRRSAQISAFYCGQSL